MKLLYTITAYPPSLGGAQLQFHTFAQHFSEHHQIGAVYQWDEQRTDWLRGTTIDAPPPRDCHQHDQVRVCRIAPTAAQRAALRWWVYGYPLLQGAAIHQISAALLPHIQTAAINLLSGQPDIVHNSRIGREGITAASLAYARSLDVPFVLTPNHHHHWHGWFYRHYIHMYREADALTVYTDYEKETLIRLGVDPDRIYVVGVGPILAERGDGKRFRQRCGLDIDSPLILFLGQKYHYKRFQWLVEAMSHVWRKFPNARAVLIGPETTDSRAKLRAVDDHRIKVLDIVSLEEKTDALAACDVLCVPSARESFGAVYLEAWQFKKPVIGGTAPASQIIIETSGGGLHGSQSSGELSDQLCELLADADKRAQMGAQGYAFAQHYTWDRLVNRMKTVYDKIYRAQPD